MHDRTHDLKVNYVYELPIGPGKLPEASISNRFNIGCGAASGPFISQDQSRGPDLSFGCAGPDSSGAFTG